MDKKAYIQAGGEKVLEDLQRIVPLSREEAIAAMRQAMNRDELQMYDLAVFCEGESLRAHESGSHFAACLMSSAMNEAFLGLLVLRYKERVKATKQYGYSSRKKPSWSYEQVVSKWALEQLIAVAEELKWIPADIVDETIKVALAEGYRELMPLTEPEMSPSEIDAGASQILLSPGPIMLRTTQSLRNGIHALRWMKSKSPFVAEHFAKWCHFATLLGAETALCLIHRFLAEQAEKVNAMLRDLTKVVGCLPPDARAFVVRNIQAKIAAKAF